MKDPGEVTRLLSELGQDGGGLDRLLPLVYEELRRMAQRQMSAERPDHTLQPTALVHEAYLKLSRLDRIEWQNRAHFFAVAAQAMRRVLVDHALARRAAKRGGGVPHVALQDDMLVSVEDPEQVLAVHAALARLEQLEPRLARVVECRYFAGLSVEETAAALEVSPPTVKRDWSVARAWLNRELGA